MTRINRHSQLVEELQYRQKYVTRLIADVQYEKEWMRKNYMMSSHKDWDMHLYSRRTYGSILHDLSGEIRNLKKQIKEETRRILI